jgi:hypothetical protein
MIGMREGWQKDVWQKNEIHIFATHFSAGKSSHGFCGWQRHAASVLRSVLRIRPA